ncbi:MAG: hypothetical protein QXH58_01385 [Nitrososphaerales archaeon]
MNIRYPLLKERIKEIITKEYERLNAGERLDLSPKSIWSKIKDENISKPSDRQLRRYIDEGIKPLLGEGRAKLIIERKPIIISYRRKVLVKGSGIIKSGIIKPDKCPYCGSKNLRHLIVEPLT